MEGEWQDAFCLEITNVSAQIISFVFRAEMP
jgi:hypothetical protein